MTPPQITRLRLRVAPGAGRSEIVGRHGDAWRIRVAAAPERGKANASVVELLAGSLGLAKRAVRVVAGQASRNKVVEVDGLTLDEAERRLAAAEERT
jgi:uncharacterized protein (TIGR00251 family)